MIVLTTRICSLIWYDNKFEQQWRQRLLNIGGCMIQDFLRCGATNFPPTDDRMRSDRARPKAVLGVGAEGGCPTRKGGTGVIGRQNK